MSSITFLGTAGGRMVVTTQTRKSGGMWLQLADRNFVLDPGPGCLLRCVELGFNPKKLDCIILSHRHIDHTNDVNIMIEAMSGGGFQPKGSLIAPYDCLEGDDPVVFKYVRSYIKGNIKILKDKFEASIGNVRIKTGIRLSHAGVDAFGLKFSFEGKTLGYVADTQYFEGIGEAFRGMDYLIINMVRLTHDRRFQHLIPADVIKIINAAKPGMVILNHFGMQVVTAPPARVAKKIEDETGVHVVAAEDGMKLELDASMHRHAMKDLTLENFIQQKP